MAGAIFVGCGGDDPGGSTRDPGATTKRAAGGSEAQGTDVDAGARGTLFGDPPGADAAASYRDPRAGDGACSAPNVVCGGGDAGDAGACVDVGSDVLNCGACGNACMGGGAVCIARSCACSAVGFGYCATGTMRGCIDVTSDVNNCGTCGNACDPGQFNACVGGTCTSQ